MIRSLKRRLFNKQADKEAVRVEGQRGASLAETLEHYSEAVTFAEAGLHHMAQTTIRDTIQERHKILVVGREDSFSRPLVDYAVGFAQRMGYDIVALNCVPFGHEAPEVLQPFKDELRRQFECKAAEGVEGLVCRAEEAGVTWRHVVKFGSMEQCVRETHAEMRRIEFVLTEPESDTQDSLEPAIPVFCLAE